MYMPRQTRTALITGGSSGLGAQFAEQLAQRGYDLALVARSSSRLQRVAEHVRTTHSVRVDVITQTSPHRTRPTASAPGSPPTAALSTCWSTAPASAPQAGSSRSHPARTTTSSWSTWSRSPFSPAPLVPGMLDSGDGAIINVGSATGFQPAPYFAAYSAAKAHVLNFSLALRAEYRHRGLRVLALMPGPTDIAFVNTIGPGQRSAGE